MIKTYEINLEESAKILETLPEKPKSIFTAREIIESLHDKIESALNKNYTFIDLAELIFKPNGVAISGKSLKSEYNKFVEDKLAKSKPRKYARQETKTNIEQPNIEPGNLK